MWRTALYAGSAIMLGLTAWQCSQRFGPEQWTRTEAVRVIDGDTWTIGRTRYRHACIDAPEIGTRAGAQAARVFYTLVAGLTPRTVPTGKRGRYGRVLAHLYVYEGEVGSILIERGLATNKFC